MVQAGIFITDSKGAVLRFNGSSTRYIHFSSQTNQNWFSSGYWTTSTYIYIYKLETKSESENVFHNALLVAESDGGINETE